MAAAIVIFLAVATVAYGRATNYGQISLADLPRLFDVSTEFQRFIVDG
jgi:hypothetical protein